MAKEKPETKLCKHCKTEIPFDAKVCPNCRKKVKGGKLKWIIIALVALGLLGAAFGGNDDEKNDADSVQTQQEAVDQSADQDGAKEEAAEETTEKKKIKYKSYDCTELFDDLESNAMKAEKKHQDEYVKVTGYVGTIDSDGAYIGVGAAEDNYDYMFSQITCYIQNEDQLNKVMELTKGDKITVKGQITSIGEVLGYDLDIMEVK